VQEVVVIARADQPGNQHLVAYVVSNTEFDAISTQLRSFLKDKLPNYMIPSAIVCLEEMPLTPNGKVDRRALPSPDMRHSLKASYVAPRDTLELQLAQIWEEVLNIRPIGVRDNFFDLGGHSLLSISLMARIQQQFGRNLSVAVLFQGGTIEHLASILRQQTGSRISSTVIALQSGGFKQPFFCVHPGQGTVLSYLELARYLGPEQPFYGLESLGLYEEKKPYDRVEDMAAHYIEAMQTVQPQGPYLLGGWSFGGLVAFEMAQQLQAQGQQVSFLGLIEAYAINSSSEEEELQEDGVFLLNLLTMDKPVQDNSILLQRIQQLEPDEQLRHVIEYARSANLISLDFGVAEARGLIELFNSHFRAGCSYIPQPYPGKVTLFVASEEKVEEPTLGWEKLAHEGVEIHSVPGNHQSIVSKPHVQVLAEQLRVCLEQSQANN
ncbi:MAG: non-ribosomal peptide synthetase, partial [Aetokthonos hydrillicola CCALA 1050]|nr:non-ribosomal peptide synthetase [Aetokthonos hydrillicola CCALA 1050]